jgi:hypothetical protein
MKLLDHVRKQFYRKIIIMPIVQSFLNLPFELLSPRFCATNRCSSMYIISPPRLRYKRGSIRFAIIRRLNMCYFSDIKYE